MSRDKTQRHWSTCCGFKPRVLREGESWHAMCLQCFRTVVTTTCGGCLELWNANVKAGEKK